MAGAQRRRRKHRGTQAGTIRQTRTRPRSRAEARNRAQSARAGGRGGPAQKGPPTWQGAVLRGAIAAGSLFLILALLLKAPIGGAIGLSLFAAAIYTPAFHAIDTFSYRRRQAKAAAEREEHSTN
jgi:hypothetical protein